MTLAEIQCAQCEGSFQPRTRIQRFCSKKCQTAYYWRDSLSQYLPTATIGAISELVVAVNLLSQGFEVFRAMSSACSCDLIALKGNTHLRIEVRTGRFSPATGRLQFAKNTGSHGRREESAKDHYAVVVDGREIVYLPALDQAAVNGA